MKENREETGEESLTLLKPAYKMWLETREGYVFGAGALELLQEIQKVGTLSGGAKALGMSYRHAWGIIKEIEERIGNPLLDTHKGGKLGGGGSELTPTGRELIKTFLKFKSVFDQIHMDELSWENLFVKMSARNRIEGTVVSVKKGEIAATVKIKIDVPCIITSFITREAVDDLKIEEGNKATAVIKATEVMVSKNS